MSGILTELYLKVDIYSSLDPKCYGTRYSNMKAWVTCTLIGHQDLQGGRLRVRTEIG